MPGRKARDIDIWCPKDTGYVVAGYTEAARRCARLIVREKTASGRTPVIGTLVDIVMGVVITSVLSDTT